MHRPLLLCILGWLWLALPLCAQAPSEAERSAVQLQALLRVLGPAPYEHPAGAAGRLCLGPDALPSRSTAVDTADLGAVRGLLSNATGLPVTAPQECIDRPAPTFGDWIIDRGSGEPALLLGVAPLEQTRPDTLDILVSARRGGRWGRGDTCVATRTNAGWEVQTCRMLWIS